MGFPDQQKSWPVPLMLFCVFANEALSNELTQAILLSVYAQAVLSVSKPIWLNYVILEAL